MCVGLISHNVLPSPNDQFKLSAFVVVLLVKLTVNGAVPNTGVALKSGTGNKTVTLM